MSNPRSSRGTILLVDDEDAFRAGLALLLRLDGWEVREAADGAEAIEQVKVQPPDILLLDHRMPGLTGTEVYQRLRQAGLTIPAIMVTAAHDVEHLAQSVGIPHFLKKPIEFEQLQAVLAKVA